MPFPEAIAALYKGHDNVNPDTERQEYTERMPDYRLYLDLLEMDGTKMQRLLERHGPKETDKKYELRQKLAIVFNLVPMLVQMYRGYLFGQEPRIDVGEDPDLTTFLDDCDGNGTNWVQFVGESILPLMLVMGFQDVLVQNPLAIGDLSTVADEGKLKPKVFCISATKRINWSTRFNGEYNWVTFKDSGAENFNPLVRNTTRPESYITISAKLPDDAMPGAKTGYWIRQWPAVVTQLNPQQQMAYTDGAYLPPTAETDAAQTGRFWAEADFVPTERCPVATVYYKRSNDPDRRHDGISKIDVIAPLTKYILQVLSWTTEDLLANLAILALPTARGQPPVGKKPAKPTADATTETELGPFSTINFPMDAKHAPLVVQGDATHIDAKMKIVDKVVNEILRLCNLMFGSQGKADRTSSGVHAVVQGNELFMDLKDVAGNLDRFTFEVLALVKSWATGKDVSVDDLKAKGVTIDYFKGEYTTDPLDAVIANAISVIEMFRSTSPTMCESAMEDVVRAYIYSGNPKIETILKEIRENAPDVLAQASADALLAEAAAIAERKVTGTATTTETTQETAAA